FWRPIHCGVDSRLVRWNDITADHTMGTIPNTTMRSTAGKANAQPAKCSDWRTRRALTPPPSIRGLGRHGQEPVGLRCCLVQGVLGGSLPLDPRDDGLPQRR